MTNLLYRWPAAAKFGRMVPKAKFYEQTIISTAVRGRFVTEVQRITWAYKLAEATVHLRGDDSVPEIQVFSIEAKEDDVSDDVLGAIDQAIPFPIIFEISRHTDSQSATCMVAAHKQLIGPKSRLSAYFRTEWQPTDVARVPLPAALDLPGLYSGILMPLVPIAKRPGEGLSAATGRMEQARKLEREVAALEKRFRSETQFNRKVELRRRLRARAAELAQILDAATPMTKDTPWTNS